MRTYLKHIKNFDKNVLYTILFSFIFNIANSIFNVIYNLYLLKLNFDEKSIGSIISGASFGIIIFSFLAIFLASKLGYKKHLLISVVIATIFNFLRVFITFPTELYWLNFLASGMMFSMSVLVYPLIIGAAKKESLTYAFGLNFFASWTALTLGNLIGGYLPNLYGIFSFSTLNAYKMTLITGSLVMLLALFPVLKLNINKEHKAQYLTFSRLKNFFKDKQDHKIMYEYFFTALIIGLAAGLFVPFFNVILKNKFNMNSSTIGIVMAISQIITAFGGIVGPLISEKLGRVQTVVLLNLLSLPFLLIMGFTNTIMIFLGAFLLRNVFINMGEPVSSSFILSNIHDDKKIILNSLVSVFFQLGWFIQAPIAGNLMMNYGYSFVFFLAASIYLIRIVFYYFFFRNADKSAKEYIKAG